MTATASRYIFCLGILLRQ